MKRLLALFAFFALTATAQENLTRLLRQPDVHGNQVVFVYGGDLWLASTGGGEARRLTSDDGIELFPKFSPDGKWIAFSGEYSGTRQVYVISVDGGAPRQLTFYNDIGPLPPRGGIDNRVLDWTPDGKNILFLSHRVAQSDRLARPYIIPAAGGMEQPLAIPEGGGGAYSPDGTKLVYTPTDREFRTWKRYHGGRAQDVWIYDLVHNTSEQITHEPMTDNQPVWIGDTIYFTSDREGGKLNLYAYDLKSKQTTKVTNHTDYDVLWPSSDASQVVYECGGYIYRYANGKEERIPIRVVGDFRGMLPYFKNVKGNIESWVVSPTGARALFVARGDLFTVPAKNGEIRNLTSTTGVRERDAAWSPDGRSMAYLSDKDGKEYELYVCSTDTPVCAGRQLTNGSKAWNLSPIWSPDSKQIAWADKDHTLHVIDAASGRITDVDKGRFDDINFYSWSPDSKWIAYTKVNQARFNEIWLWSAADGKTYQLTSGMTDDNEPVFDPKGRYLYFISNRDFNLTFSAFEFNYVYTDPLRVYVGVLAADGPALFLPQSDEEKAPPVGQAPPPVPPAPTPTPTPAPVTVKIDVAGFESRVRAIPGAAGNYRSLAAVPTGVLYLTGRGGATKLNLYNVDDRKEETVVDGARGYDLSANREKVLVQSGETYAIVAAKPGQKLSDGALNLEHLDMKIDPRAEWRQEFVDAWRILRDWFYDPNMHGNDWNAVRERYAQLVPFVASRADLDYIFGELAGEVGSGHVYVQSPDDVDPVKRVDNGLLGADIVPADGVFRIQHIYPGENWHDAWRSPLTEPGVHAHEGEYIVAVDGVSTRGVDNLYRLLENKAGHTVTLSLASNAGGSGAHDEKVRPITKETNVRYLDWVASRRAYVDKASGGRIGYIHLPDTATEGNRELFKYFYPLAGKDALIIDDRYNGGGFIPDRMIELLDRPLLNYWTRRDLEPGSTPAYANEGPKVMLTNMYAGSGGDALPYYFRKRKLGTIIGTRTWGGLIGLSGNPSVMDGGSITVPTFRFLDTQGMWAVEGEGVSPDIEVIDRPELIAAGHDPSLEKAVEVLLQQLKEHPPAKVVVPPPPGSK